MIDNSGADVGWSVRVDSLFRYFVLSLALAADAARKEAHAAVAARTEPRRGDTMVAENPATS